ncbi:MULTISPECIES: ORF6N domain-containing protein [Acinetobacter]|uniref:ORF6N domain-containing protein n=1 Tax=Acinetobacter chengduensis TaxID=2420890 RepID=A0ABX9TS67_9GAMM|nr:MULTISPECIES: ORF6N domain-containing protein [Acinetobacter]RKG37854.1 ORF6N domain-containing protein [Acinetobacter sp. WCHAc060007]RLL17569.1 ORF6N domain-containing protein [Acinetobacter chengduensis]
MNIVANINDTEISIVNFKSIPVVTTAMLADFYATDVNNIQQNYSRNKIRFVEGKHFIKISGQDLKEFVTVFKSVATSSKVRSLILWTERGAARHAKMLDTDQAWEVFEQLEDCYFRNNVSQPDTLTDINNRIPLANAVGMLVGKSSFNTKEIYDMLNQRFAVNHVNQIPLQLLPNAVEYIHNLMTLTARSNEFHRQDQCEVQQLVEAIIKQNFKMMNVWNALRFLNHSDFFTYSGLIVRSNQLAQKLSKRYNLKGENGEPLVSQNFRQVSFSNGETLDINPNWFNAPG